MKVDEILMVVIGLLSFIILYKIFKGSLIEGVESIACNENNCSCTLSNPCKCVDKCSGRGCNAKNINNCAYCGYDKNISKNCEICPCCPAEMIDYVIFSNGHLQPDSYLFEIIKPKSKSPFKINKLKHELKIHDLSDHYPAIGTFIKKDVTLKVFNYNVFARWTMAGQEAQVDRLKEIPNYIPTDIDVITIQEAWCPGDIFVCLNNNSRDILTGGLNNIGFTYKTEVIGIKNANNKLKPICFTNGGVIIYSKHKIIGDPHYEIFEDSGGDDQLACKGFISIHIKKGDIDYTIISAHLQAWIVNKDIRMKQLQQIKNYIVSNETNLKKHMVIISADMNIDLIQDKGEYTKMIHILGSDGLPSNFMNNIIASSDPYSNTLVGMDGAAKDLSCNDEYYDNLLKIK
tara:strand:- start:6 stop:1211 length:1206 start_codon:yes stop_codon:yes gene_type:complete